MNSQSAVRLAVLAGLLAAPAVVPATAWAQASPEAVPTATGDGYVDPNAKIAPAGSGPVRTAPAPKTLYKGPLDRLADIPRSNILSNVHGSVGVMIGTHNTRAAYVDMHGPIGDRASFGLNFSTIHSDALPIYDGGYGGYGGYASADGLYPSGAALGYDRRYRSGYPGYGYGSGTGYSLGASVQLGDSSRRYDRVWPNYMPPREEVTDVTDEPVSSSQ